MTAHEILERRKAAPLPTVTIKPYGEMNPEQTLSLDEQTGGVCDVRAVGPFDPTWRPDRRILTHFMSMEDCIKLRDFLNTLYPVETK